MITGMTKKHDVVLLTTGALPIKYGGFFYHHNHVENNMSFFLRSFCCCCCCDRLK